MYAQVDWHHGLSFTGTADSGFTVNLGGKKAAGGDEDGFRPLELFLVGLGGCTGMDVISILRKKRQDVTDFRVSVSAETAAEHPHVFTSIQIHYTFEGHQIDSNAVERAILLSETKYCPAQAMLSQVAAIHSSYEIIEVLEPVT